MSKNTQLRGAAIGSLVALALAATANAAPASHHRHHAASSDATQINAELVAQVNALTARVNDLTARLDAQASAQQQTAQVAQAAQAQASQVASQVEVAQADVKRIPETVHSEVAKDTKPGWWGNTSVSGRMYWNLSEIDQKVDGTRVRPSGTGFDIKRFYLGVDHKFNDVWSANLTMDMQYSSGVSATEFYVKKAYLQAHLSDAVNFRFGSADMPWIPFAEDVYGYRFLEQTITDRDKFGNSADWGVHMLGKLADGHVGYQVSVVNGAGYKKPGFPGDSSGPGGGRSQAMDVEARLDGHWGPFVAAIGGYDGYLGKDVVGHGALHAYTRFNAIAAYSGPVGRLGVEYFDAHNQAVTAVDKANGTAVFGNWNFMPQLSAFARYDWETPNGTTAPSKRENYYNLGLNWEPTKIVDLALVYKRDNVDHGNLATGLSAVNIGGASASALSSHGVYDEFGVFGQVRW